MSILDFLYHRHYWSLPHRSRENNRIIQICYDCGRERQSPLVIATPGKPDAAAVEEDTKKAQSGFNLNLDNAAATAVKPTT